MIILIAFAFIAGIVTILSPCILPILPIILATSIGDDASRKRPYGIVAGFILSFTFFTLFLSSIVKQLGIPADTLRNFSIIVIALFGLSLIIPRFQLLMEGLFARLANFMPTTAGKSGFGGGIAIGLSLGLLWTPCVGPILASVISLAITGTVTSDAFFLTLAYSLGTAIPMYLVILSGRTLFTRLPWLLSNTSKIQKIFGVVMIMTAFAIYRGYDRTFQTYVLTKFPSYGAGLTQFEDKAFVKDELKMVGKRQVGLLSKGNLAPEFRVGGEWFNLDGEKPPKLVDLKGKVVLVDFWTYTCINCQRTLPYLKSWDEKYRDKGLVIIGVHAPEFEFEKKPSNVAMAIKDFGLKYLVMQDNDFATWKSYKNHYWPAKYLIDKDGNIRYTHFGEGNYDDTEIAIQELLAEKGVEVSDTPDNPVDLTYGRTPETYLGSSRSNNESYLSYEGKWTQDEEYNSPAKDSKLNLRFDAKNVYLVMRNKGQVAKLKVYLDGIYQQTIEVDVDKLYELVKLDNPGTHSLQLEFVDDNAELFAFTFG